jgi:hypothetical protein
MVLNSKEGINKGHKLLSQYAKENSFAGLMSNYSGNLGDMESGGKSGFWDKNGKLRAELDSKNEGLLIIEKLESSWGKKNAQTKKMVYNYADDVHVGEVSPRHIPEMLAIVKTTIKKDS